MYPQDGLCVGTPNPDMWFRGIPNPNSTSKETMAKVDAELLEAISICNLCPVQRECLKVGLHIDNEHHGIWGGKLAGERLEMNGRKAVGAAALTRQLIMQSREFKRKYGREIGDV